MWNIRNLKCTNKQIMMTTTKNIDDGDTIPLLMHKFYDVTVFNHKIGYPKGVSCILPLELEENTRILYE